MQSFTPLLACSSQFHNPQAVVSSSISAEDEAFAELGGGVVLPTYLHVQNLTRSVRRC